MKKTFAFFTIETGIAHVARSLALAEELHKRGRRTIFALPKRKWSIFKNTKLRFIDVSPCSKIESINVVNIVRNAPFLKKLALEDLTILKKYHPDGVIVDFRPSTISAGIHLGIPTYCLTGSTALPYISYIPNLFQLSPLIVSPVSRLIQLLVARAKRKYLMSPLVNLMKGLGTSMSDSEFTGKIKYLVPESPSYLPMQNTRQNVFFVGHLTWKGFYQDKPSWLNHLNLTDKKTVYVSFGGTGFDKSKLISLCSHLVKKGYIVIVSSGTIAEPSDFPVKDGKLFVEKFLPSAEVLPKVDFVICHGGYGTMIESVTAGKPVIAIPFNPDQWLHAVRFQELGLGICTVNSSLSHLIKTITLDWEGFQKLSSATAEEKILNAADDISNNYDHYKKAIDKFKNRILPNQGAEFAADIVESKT